jgi:hypothetical protein
MAIENKENPDEGTPRSKKDIRKDRREMRSINRQRKAMGGEPLYVDKDFEDIKKPFKAEPGNIVAGTPVVEDTNPDVEYIRYDAAGPGQEPKESRSVFKAGTNEAIAVKELATGETQDGNAIIEALRKKDDQDPNKTFTSSIENNKNIKNIGNVINNDINKTNENILEKKENLDKKEDLPGSGASAISALRGSENNITWDQTYKSEGLTPESREDVFERAASSARRKAPQLAIEKLGVQDYYPEIGRDIAVGTFTGSRIGSQTIYSGAGGLLPLGLYDARKRAIANEIKRKEALMDELKSVPDIAKQFKPEWTNYVFDKWANYMEAYKNNPDGLSNDMGFAKTNAQLKAIAENFKDVDVYLDDFKSKLMDKDGNAAAWATPRMLEIAKKFNSGFTPEKLEEFFSGKKNIANLKETVEAIPNGYKHIDTRLNELLKEPNKVKRAITPKDGIEWTPELKNKINDLSQQVSDGSIDYERYLTVMKEYFDIDFSPMINEWVDANDLGALSEAERKAYKESLNIYALAQMPKESFIPSFVTANNDNASRYAADQALKGKLAAINWDREKWEREQRQNPTNALIDAAMASKDGKFTQDYAGSKANTVPASKIYVDVIGKDGKVIKQWASALKNNVDKNGNIIVPYRNLSGRLLTADDYKNIPDEITYQPNQGTVRSVGNGNYAYSNSGIGYMATTKADQNGNTVTSLKGLGLDFSMPEVPAVQGGKKIESTIDGGNVFFGQGANQQTYKTRESSSSGSFERE